MRMFHIPKDTAVHVIKEGTEWEPRNLKPHTTKQDNLFDLCEMRIDPTGIGPWCNGPGNVTVGSYYAERGCYAFARDGWVMLVHGNYVQVW